VKFSVVQNLVDDPEIVHDFEAAGLQAFALRSDEVSGRFVDNPKLYAAPGEIAGQSQPRRSGTGN
jgi:hypothetical protein